MHRGSSSQRTLAALILTIGAAVLLLIATPAWTQSFRGSIRGTVTDPSGSVIAGAKVSARNIGTGQQREAATGADGGYVLAELPAGEYTVTAESAGLSPSAQNVQVNVGLDTTANFDLTKVEKRTEQLTVTAEAPVIETTRDVLGEIVERKLVVDLPLNGRDFGKLVALTPGVTVDPSGVAGTQGGFGQFNINGNRDRSNNYSLDGTDNNDPYFNNSALNQVGITGAPATLLPIDAIQEFNLQSQFGAEYGRNSGSVVNIVTRSGTNQFHGSAFEFLRNSALDARNFFNTEPRHTSFRNNNFGAAVGGPVVKDKTFFFGAYEGQREAVGSDFVLGVPTNQEISQAQVLALSSGQIVTVNPALLNILSTFYPTSDSSSIASVVNDTNNLDNLNIKLEHNLANNELITGRYAFGQSNQSFPLGSQGGFGKGSRLPEFAQTSPARVQVASFSWLSTLSATSINEVRVGYSRYRTSFSSVDLNQKFDPASLGTTQFPFNLGTGKLGLPELDFSGGIENLGAQGFSVPRGRTSETYQFLDNFTWLHGKHTFKFGGEFRWAAVDNFNDNLERGILSFGSDNSSFQCQVNPLPGCDDAVSTSLANLFIGNTFPSILTGNTQRTTYNKGLSFFGQDDYRLAPKFTLNLGLRWEYFGPLSEKHNLLSNIGNDGLLAMVGTDGVSGAYKRQLTNFSPRIGLAWNVSPNTVVRGGYGIFYDYVPQDLLIANFPSSAGIATNPIGPLPVYPMNYDPTAFDGTNAGAPIFTVNNSGPFNVFVTPRNFRTPYVQNFNVNVQQRLAENTSLEIGYVGSKGTHLVRLYDANQPDANFNFPNSNFMYEDTLAPNASSTYHALQSTLRIQGAHGVSGFATYNYSKSLDDASDGIDFVAGAAFPQDSTNLKAERGPSTFDTKHRFTAALNYDLPAWHALPKTIGAGWSLNWVVSAQSGRPIPIANGNDNSGRFYFNQRPNLLPGVSPILPNWTPASGYLNPLAFQQPADGTFGNLSRNSIYGPGYTNVDFSLLKNTRLLEHLGIQFRAEFFNILNHPNFALPSAGSFTPGLDQFGGLQVSPQGTISQTPDVAQGNPGLGGGGPRVIQVGLKLVF